MIDVEVREYIRNEWRNDASWMVEVDRKNHRTSVGVLDLIGFMMRRKHARKQDRCCC